MGTCVYVEYIPSCTCRMQSLCVGVGFVMTAGNARCNPAVSRLQNPSLLKLELPLKTDSDGTITHRCPFLCRSTITQLSFSCVHPYFAYVLEGRPPRTGPCWWFRLVWWTEVQPPRSQWCRVLLAWLQNASSYHGLLELFFPSSVYLPQRFAYSVSARGHNGSFFLFLSIIYS